MTKFDQSWSQVNQPADQKFQLIPALIVLAGAEMIVILSLINNCGGVL